VRLFKVNSTSRCVLILTHTGKVSIKMGGYHKWAWRTSYVPNTGFIVGQNCNTDHGFKHVIFTLYMHLYIHEPRICDSEGNCVPLFPIYDTYFVSISYTPVHRPAEWNHRGADMRIKGSLTASESMFWKFGIGSGCYVEWRAKEGVLYKVYIKERWLNWEGNIPVKVYKDTWNEIYLENELWTYNEASTWIEGMKPTQATVSNMSINFNDHNNATADVSNGTVTVQFVTVKRADNKHIAYNYAELAALKAAGLVDGTVKGLRFVGNQSTGGYTIMRFAFNSVWTKPRLETPDRGYPRNWSQ
jgi:hypothetical protein